MRKLRVSSLVGALVIIVLGTASADQPTLAGTGINLAQVPKWSSADLAFFLHGSMGTEVIPENVLRAFMATYPDLFPTNDLTNFGLIPDAAFGWPVGISRREVPHLGGLPSIGINCAACHVGQIDFSATAKPVRVLGTTAHFDAEAFLGAIVVATFRTSDPANMRRYLENYLATFASQGTSTHEDLEDAWSKQKDAVQAVMTEDPFGSKSAGPGGLQEIAAKDLTLNGEVIDPGNLVPAVRAQLKLMHNMRTALHVPDQPPPPSPPNGPGRNDPWRILSYTLLGVVTKPAQVKFGIVWNEEQRNWVHVDANTRAPIIRNLAASLGLGAPLIGHTGVLNFADVERHTTLSEIIRPPRYPLAVDRAAADAGAKIYRKNCASCHDGPLRDQRLHAVAEIGTDPNRAEIFTPNIAEQFNQFFARLQIPGYHPPEKPIRSTQKYWAPRLAGVWARAPYLHNGSVRTMLELLTPPAERAKTFHVGARAYDPVEMGYVNDGAYVLDTATPGNGNTGHAYGTNLSDKERSELIEYLKTL